ncbi:MAG: hypothetical protein ABR591_01720 [Candidatus Velthaea sp.]
MPVALSVHYVFAMLVAAGAVAIVWWRWGRRIMLYALSLHILIGVWVIVSGMRAPSLHLAFAGLGWAGYMAANAIGRRPNRENAALAVTIGASACVLVAFAIGQWALKPA